VRLSIALTCALGAAGIAHAATITVPTDLPTIQGAIDASTEGNTVLVLPGTYAEHEIDLGGRAIVVRGSDPGDSTVVAAPWSMPRARGRSSSSRPSRTAPVCSKG